MAEAAYIFGWTPEKILGMRAVLFFKVLKHGRKIYQRERALQAVDMCDAMTVSLSAQNYKSMRDGFMKRAFPEHGKRKALPLDDARTAQIAAAMFRSVPQNARRH